MFAINKWCLQRGSYSAQGFAGEQMPSENY